MDYKKIAEEALRRAQQKNNILSEDIIQSNEVSERMHPQLEKELRTQKTSLGKHPIFPDGDETNFEQKILSQRFADVVKRFKRTYDVENINNQAVIKNMMGLVYETVGIESKFKQELCDLAVKMVREEYDMDEDAVEIHVELKNTMSLEIPNKNPSPKAIDGMVFEKHDDIINANEEVYKRRFINAMIQGAAKKCNHMFHMVDDELSEMDPRLPNKYAKMMSAADYLYYVIPKMDEGVKGGVVKVKFPTEDNPKAIIYAEAMVFPVLIHELVKGVMELLSAHGLPKDKMIGEYVLNKADFLAAEPWDMRLGPALWEQFTNLFEPDDFNMKHFVYADLCALPVKEFNTKMKEIMANTKEGKKIIDELVNKAKTELHEDEFNTAMESLNVEDYSSESNDDNDFDWDDIASIF